MRLTKNRQRILEILSIYDDDDSPPRSAGDIQYRLNGSLWDVDKQLFRTLRELWHLGLIVAVRKRDTRQLGRTINDEDVEYTQERWTLEYECAADFERNNYIERELGDFINACNNARSQKQRAALLAQAPQHLERMAMDTNAPNPVEFLTNAITRLVPGTPEHEALLSVEKDRRKRLAALHRSIR